MNQCKSYGSVRRKRRAEERRRMTDDDDSDYNDTDDTEGIQGYFTLVINSNFVRYELGRILLNFVEFC